MNMRNTYKISHLIILILGLLFYTSIGLLFVITDFKLRVIVFLLLLLVANFKKEHFLIITISCIVGFIINPHQNWNIMASNLLSWGALTGSILGSLLIYDNIFSGGDFASTSRFFKNKNSVAIHAYYAFKIIPMILDLLDRLLKAYVVYGKKKYIGKKKATNLNILIDVIDSFFNELLTVMFSQTRIMKRRECIANVMSQKKRSLNCKLILIQSAVTLSVLIFFLRECVISYNIILNGLLKVP